MVRSSSENQQSMYTLAAGSLDWNEWDGIQLVYQRASAETHVFNETTSLILKCLEHGPAVTAEIKKWTEEALGLDRGELDAEEFSFAAQRLDELGLIERVDDVAAAQ